MKNERYHTNYKGQLVDNTKDWEYKPLTKKTPVEMLNNLNDEFEKIDELFRKAGLKGYDYDVLRKIMDKVFRFHHKRWNSLLAEANVIEDTIVVNGKKVSAEELCEKFNLQNTALWEALLENNERTSDMETMQQKINVLYTEIMMAKEHMGIDEWEDFKSRRKELEKKVGVEWIRV